MSLLRPVVAQPVWDWDEDARWQLQLQSASPSFWLGQFISDFGLSESAEEMTVLPQGLLVRHRDRRTVNLTVLEGSWRLLRNQQVLGQSGATWESWQGQVGPPQRIFQNPAKVARIYYYRSSLSDIGLMVADGIVHSIMLVEPGYLLPALERTGYSEKGPEPRTH